MNFDKTKILFCINSIYPISIGGTEIYVYNLANELQKMGNVVAILCATGEKNVQEGSYFNIPFYGIPFDDEHGLNFPAFKNVLKDFSPQIFHLHSLGKIFGAREYEYANSIGINCFFTPHLAENLCVYLKKSVLPQKLSIYNCLKARIVNSNVKLKYPIWMIYTVVLFSIPFKSFRKIIPEFFLNAIIDFKNLQRIKNSSLGVISLAPWISLVFKNYGFSNIIEIPQGVNSIFSNSSKTEIKTHLEIVFIGRISPEKGIELLIDALKKLPRNRFSLKIVGSGDASSAYTKKIMLLAQELNASVQLNKSQAEVAQILKDSDILCLPTVIREVAPLVVEEARAAKKICVVSDINNSCFFSKKGILFFQNQSGTSLSEVLSTLTSDTVAKKRLDLNDYTIADFSLVANRHLEEYNYTKSYENRR